MLKYFICLTFLLGVSLSACSDGSLLQTKQKPTSGFSTFGMMSPRFLTILPQVLSLNINKVALLWRSFGSDPKNLDEWLKTPGVKAVEIHMLNGAGRRNQRLGDSDLFPHMGINELNHAIEYRTHDVEIRLWIAEISLFAMERPGVNWILSLGLESNYTSLAAMRLLQLVTDEWPYEIAYNPLNPNDCDYMPDSVYCETHSIPTTNQHTRCIVSNDGIDFSSKEEALDFIERNQHCIVLLWSGETQGVGTPFIPTLEREFKFDNVGFFKEVLSEGLN